jgi:hypothetical protein
MVCGFGRDLHQEVHIRHAFTPPRVGTPNPWPCSDQGRVPICRVDLLVDSVANPKTQYSIPDYRSRPTTALSTFSCTRSQTDQRCQSPFFRSRAR